MLVMLWFILFPKILHYVWNIYHVFVKNLFKLFLFLKLSKWTSLFTPFYNPPLCSPILRGVNHPPAGLRRCRVYCPSPPEWVLFDRSCCVYFFVNSPRGNLLGVLSWANCAMITSSRGGGGVSCLKYLCRLLGVQKNPHWKPPILTEWTTTSIQASF